MKIYVTLHNPLIECCKHDPEYCLCTGVSNTGITLYTLILQFCFPTDQHYPFLKHTSKLKY